MENTCKCAVVCIITNMIIIIELGAWCGHSISLDDGSIARTRNGVGHDPELVVHGRFEVIHGKMQSWTRNFYLLSWYFVFQFAPESIHWLITDWDFFLWKIVTPRAAFTVSFKLVVCNCISILLFVLSHLTFWECCLIKRNFNLTLWTIFKPSEHRLWAFYCS